MRHLLSAEPLEHAEQYPSLRPLALADFVGQEALMRNLSVFISAARGRDTAMDHTLFYGPPGLGKTTLAHIIAHELGSTLSTTTGPVLTKPGDLAALLTHLKPMDVLFIDEIHRLPIAVEEMLYSAMEDYKIDILVGEGPHARSIQLSLAPFTLVGATTRSGLISAPLRDRFGIMLPLCFYTPHEVQLILERAAHKSGITIESTALEEIAIRCRGVPRIALRLLRRVRDFSDAEELGTITKALTVSALAQLGISPEGLDVSDQKYLNFLADQFNGGPVGIDTLSAALSETRDTLEDMIEPYLLQQGFIQRTARGRTLTDRGWERAGRGNRTLI